MERQFANWYCCSRVIACSRCNFRSIAIRTSYYTGIETVKDDVQVHGLSYVIKKIQSEDRLLIVDDVHDTGISIEK